MKMIAVGAILLAGLATTASADPPPAYKQAMDPYFAELARQCPAKHLELLSPADLDDVLEDFLETLPKADLPSYQSAAASACKNAIAGVTCGNVATIETANEQGRTAAIAARTCAAYKTCHEQSDCDAVTKR
jgi:hypothetical protein